MSATYCGNPTTIPGVSPHLQPIVKKACPQSVLHRATSATFGRLAIRSAYRVPAVNDFGNAHALSCANNEKNRAAHISDQRNESGCMGATACIVVPWFADRYASTGDWAPLAGWIHDHLPYDSAVFFPRLAAFNLRWHEAARRRIDSHVDPKGCLTRSGMANTNPAGSHADACADLPIYLED
jgi:hypothetical protein